MREGFSIQKNILRAFVLCAISCVMALLPAAGGIKSYAAAERKIKSLHVKITSEIEVGSEVGSENIEIEVMGTKCNVDYYELDNKNTTWTLTDYPELTIYFNAEENCIFSMKKSDAVTIDGGDFVSAVRQNDNTTLKMEVRLPQLLETSIPPQEPVLSQTGFAYWNRDSRDGLYEVRLYRNEQAVGSEVIITADSIYDFQSKINRIGSYKVRVRAMNKVHPENKSDWAESPVVEISKEAVDAIKNGVTFVRPVTGHWEYVEDGGWWYPHSDGSYTVSGWEEIDGKWYHFDETGYMQYGWIVAEDGKDYYLDGESGAMLKDTITPDGYILDANGNIEGKHYE